MQQPKLVIFDLDGTLLNTLSDLAHSVNYALKNSGYPVHPIANYKHFVGNGINKLLERALPENQRAEQNIAHLKTLFLSYYDEHMADYTQPYDNIPELLKTLHSKGLKIAVASNKYQKATERLIRRFFPDIPFTAVFGQRESVPVKPDPAIVFDILKIADLSPAEVVYVGDSAVDMLTASNSGVVSIGVTWGFRPQEELEAAKADYITASVNEILDILNK